MAYSFFQIANGIYESTFEELSILTEYTLVVNSVWLNPKPNNRINNNFITPPSVWMNLQKIFLKNIVRMDAPLIYIDVPPTIYPMGG